MDKLYIQGGRPLRGTIEISGAKNSAVALIPATILADTPTTIDNLPNISDVHVFAELLKGIGGEVQLNKDRFTLNPQHLQAIPLPNGHVKKLRASYYLMG